MKQRQVVFLASAQADLAGIVDFITDRAGAAVARNYVDRVERACLALATASERGTRYDDVAPGLRAVGFEGRVTILFRVEPETVEIVMLAYGGRNWMTLLRSGD